MGRAARVQVVESGPDGLQYPLAAVPSGSVRKGALETLRQGNHGYRGVPSPIVSAPVSEGRVFAWLQRLCPGGDYTGAYPEIASAISIASNEDPLWRDERGCERTAALLTATAYFESGGEFHPNKVKKSRFGLWQITPPKEVSADMLLLPRTAAYVAIDLARNCLITMLEKGPQARQFFYLDDLRLVDRLLGE